MVTIEYIVEGGEGIVVALNAIQMRYGVPLTVVTDGARSICGEWCHSLCFTGKFCVCGQQSTYLENIPQQCRLSILW